MSHREFDLVDEMQWEDVVEFITLEQAGLENNDHDTVGSAQRIYFAEEGDYREPSAYCHVEGFDTIEDASW